MSKSRMTLGNALQKIQNKGVLLVFPVNNAREPASLWSEVFPRKKMKWEWDESGDQSVADLWHLRAKLSSSGQVAYAKWYQGRATVFSTKLYAALIHVFHFAGEFETTLSRTSLKIFESLEDNSPQSPRDLKVLTNLKGKDFESEYNKALQQLWLRFMIVGFGEIDDGAFPSLALGSSRLLFEDLWKVAAKMSSAQAWKTINFYMPDGSLFRRYLDRTCKASLR